MIQSLSVSLSARKLMKQFCLWVTLIWLAVLVIPTFVESCWWTTNCFILNDVIRCLHHYQVTIPDRPKGLVQFGLNPNDEGGSNFTIKSHLNWCIKINFYKHKLPYTFVWVRAVSYTHLDVYKRQVQHFGEFFKNFPHSKFLFCQLNSIIWNLNILRYI